MRKYIWKILRFLNLAPFLQIFYKGILDEYGWLKSFNKMQSIDRKGNPIPWFSYCATNFIKERLTKEMNVFEFGSGNSTLWFSERVKNIVSVEHDYKWYKQVKKKVPANVNLVYSELDNNEYCMSAIKLNIKFDIVIIDGRDRNNCVYNSIDSLSEQGVIIFDNSQVPDYKESIIHLEKYGFKKIQFSGLCPSVPHSNTTTIFTKLKIA